MTENERAIQALTLAAKGLPHSGQDLALALSMVREGSIEPRLVETDLSVLSDREAEVARLIMKEALGNKAIADRLGIAVITAKHHVESIFKKLGISSRTMLVALGAKLEARG